MHRKNKTNLEEIWPLVLPSSIDSFNKWRLNLNTNTLYNFILVLMFPDRIFDRNVRLGCVSIVIQMCVTFMEKLWVVMRSLGNVSVHSILETFPLCFLLREIFDILFFVNSRAVFWLASVTFLRYRPSEVCEVRARAFDVSAHDSRLFLSRDWSPGYGSWLGSDGEPWVGSLYSVPWVDTSLLVSLHPERF